MKILFVVEVESPHSAKWINQLKDSGWEICVFQARISNTVINPEYGVSNFYLPFPQNIKNRKKISETHLFPFKNSFIRIILTKFFSYFFPNFYPRFLVKVIKEFKPDIIHSLGLNVNWNNLCLTVFRARRLMGDKNKIPWIYSSWGSDLDYYAKLSEINFRVVSDIIKQCDYLITECTRDYLLAKKMGFKGQFLGIIPATGGFSIDQMSTYRLPGLTSIRKRIILKGRDNNCKGGDPVGRAMTAIKAFEICHKELQNIEIFIFQASRNVVHAAEQLRKKYNLKISILPYVTYKDLLSIMGSSRIFISLTINDGLPISLIEALSLGTFPIHSKIESLSDWIVDGKHAALVSPHNPSEVADTIVKALHDDRLVDETAKINYDLIVNKLSSSIIKPRVYGIYHQIAVQESKLVSTINK